MSISTKPYGRDQYGNPATEYTLTNGKGASVSILDFGGIITRIIVPDRDGNLGDVNLGFDDAKAYTKDSGSMGALIGRVGNRIKDAKFVLEGETYQLDANNGPNCLHGGLEGFNLRMWKAMPDEGEGSDMLNLSLISPDGDQGFPGEMKVDVRYTFDDQNTLSIEYRAVTSKKTIINLTNHAYFNLDGHDAPSVKDLELQVLAESITELGEGLIPTGRLIPQREIAFNFEQPTRIGDVLAHTETDPAMKAAGGVDCNYCPGYDGQFKCVAVLYSPKTGREMKVYTDLPGIQVYTGQGLHQMGKDGVQYGPYGGLCLETQRYPDAIHNPQFPSFVLKPEEIYFTRTDYRFGIR